MLRALMAGLVCVGIMSAASAEEPDSPAEREAALRALVPNLTDKEAGIAGMLILATNVCGFTVTEAGKSAFSMTGTSWSRLSTIMDFWNEGAEERAQTEMPAEKKKEICGGITMMMGDILEPAPFYGHE